MAATLRFARSDEYPKLSQFLDEFWAKDHVYCRMPDLFEWAFRRDSYWPEGQYSFAVAEDEGKLAGMLGGMPFTFNEYGKQSRGVWIVNYVIRPDHRKGTLALQLLSMFRKPEFGTVVAFGINPATSLIYRVLRGEVLPEIPRHFMVLPEARERMTDLLRLVYPNREAGELKSLTDPFVSPLKGLPEAQPNSELPASWDEVDWPAIAQTTIGAARDSDFLNWRYRRHPRFQYRFLTIPTGSRTGLAVWRLETIRRKTDQGLVDVERIGRLVEFLPASPENALQLLGAFINELRAEGALGADYYGFHGATRLLFQEAGFRCTTDHPDGNAIPSRFQPLDEKGGGILSAIFLKPEVTRCWSADNCPWYWTKSDSDQDRPN
jgi:hypothetical protein